MLTFPLNFIIVVIILFTIIKALKMYSLSTYLKELLRTWDVFDKPEIFCLKNVKAKSLYHTTRSFLS